MGSQPVGRSLGSLIGTLCLLWAWSRWPSIQGMIGGPYQKYTQLLNLLVLATKELTNIMSIL